MPELPEVQVVREQLKQKVLNKKIIKIDIFHDKTFNGPLKDLDLLLGKSIVDVERYGKYLVFILSDDYNLISHLRMEGKYHIRETEEIDKHEHVIFYFEDGTNLRYHDTRKFGRMELRTKENYLTTNPLLKLGNEPSNMKKDELFDKINHRNITIKQALLDQTVIAGLGNIYVDETLFLSKVDPRRRTNTITKKEANLLTENAKVTLAKAIELGGTTISTFSATDIHGRFQNHLLVHTKEGHLCTVCNTPIIKTKVGGRGTYICEECQK